MIGKIVRIVASTLVALLATYAAFVVAALLDLPEELDGAKAFPVFVGECTVLLVGGMAALIVVARRPWRAGALIGVGLLALLLGLALLTVAPGWLHTDLGAGAMQGLGGVLAVVGSVVALVSAATLGGRRFWVALALGGPAGLALLVLGGLLANVAPVAAGGTLSGVAAVSARDVWAVGRSSSGTLVEHWDGARWQIVPGPELGVGWRHDEALAAVTAVSTRDVWAVGHGDNGALIEHWDGARWQRMPAPQGSGTGAALAGVTAIAANNVWAVGADARADTALALQWDGVRWTGVPLPRIRGALTGVAAVSPHDVWAVGHSDRGALVVHWDGRRWQTVALPDTAMGLQGVAALSPRDIWTVGAGLIESVTSGVGTQSCCSGLAARWDGRDWVEPASPASGDLATSLNAVAAVSPRDVWAVGSLDLGVGEARALIVYWDGRRWQVASSPDGAATHDVLAGVSAVSARDVWAVGGQMLIEQWDGHVWRVISPASVLPLAAILQIALVLAGVVLTAGQRRLAVVRPALLAGLAAALPILVLLVRGPGDWAMTTAPSHLYALPVVLLACVLGVALFVLIPPDQPDRWGRTASAARGRGS